MAVVNGWKWRSWARCCTDAVTVQTLRQRCHVLLPLCVHEVRLPEFFISFLVFVEYLGPHGWGKHGHAWAKLRGGMFGGHIFNEGMFLQSVFIAAAAAVTGLQTCWLLTCCLVPTLKCRPSLRYFERNRFPAPPGPHGLSPSGGSSVGGTRAGGKGSAVTDAV